LYRNETVQNIEPRPFGYLFHFAGKFEAGDTVDFAVGLGADGFHGEAVGLQANIKPITEPF